MIKIMATLFVGSCIGYGYACLMFAADKKNNSKHLNERKVKCKECRRYK